MGISLTLCIPRVGSCMGRALTAKQGKVLRIVKMDGKILEFKAPVIVKDILENFSAGSGIGLSKKALEHLPPNYQLKIGKVYYIIPSLSSSGIPPSAGEMISTKAADTEQPAGGVTRIKVVITRQQLQQLLTKEISVGEVLSALERRRTRSDCYSIDLPTSWKPKLESIPEGSE